MSTLLQCLESLPPGLVLRDLSAVRDETATVAAHIARLSLDQKEGEGYEVRREPRNFGAASTVAIGLVRGPAVYREI
jgi:hypothetical protein